MGKLFTSIWPLIVLFYGGIAYGLNNPMLCEALFSPQIGTELALPQAGSQIWQKSAQEVTVSKETLELAHDLVIDQEILFSPLFNWTLLKQIEERKISANEYFFRLAKMPPAEREEAILDILERIKETLDQALIQINEIDGQNPLSASGPDASFLEETWGNMRFSSYRKDPLLGDLIKLGIFGRADIEAKLDSLNRVLNNRKLSSGAVSLVNESLPHLSLSLRVKTLASWTGRQTGRALSLIPRGMIKWARSGEAGFSTYLMFAVASSGAPFIYESIIMGANANFYNLMFFPWLASYFVVPRLYIKLPEWKRRLQPKFTRYWRKVSDAKRKRKLRRLLKAHGFETPTFADLMDSQVNRQIEQSIFSKLNFKIVDEENPLKFLYGIGDLETEVSLELMGLSELLKISLTLDSDVDQSFTRFVKAGSDQLTKSEMSPRSLQMMGSFYKELEELKFNLETIKERNQKAYEHVQSIYDKLSSDDFFQDLDENSKALRNQKLQQLVSVQTRLLYISLQLHFTEERLVGFLSAMDRFEQDQTFIPQLKELLGGIDG